MNHSESTGMLSIDCHVHTADSYDSTASVETIVQQAKKAGLDGFVVTDHDRIERSRRAATRASDFGLIGIPGVEVSTMEGHLLAIGVTSCPTPGRPLDEAVETTRDQGGVAVIPHPFQRSRHGVSANIISDCDGVEVFNAHSLTGIRNRQAERFARAHGYPQFGGSDAHRAPFVGRGVTHVETNVARPTAEDVVAAMRAGQTRSDGRRTPSLRYIGKLVENAHVQGRRVVSG